MALPFTVDQFLDTFRAYNEAIWPLQLVAYFAGATVVAAAVWRRPLARRLIPAVLALLWLETGALYHLTFFARINGAARLFGAFFLAQGLLFAVEAVLGRLHFALRLDGYGATGALIVLYAMVLYPVIGAALGHGFPASPSFGVTPCPLTLFTFGVLLWTERPVPKHLIAIPLLWSLLGSTAALSLGIREDLGMLAAGLVGTALLVLRDRRGLNAGSLRAG